MKNMITLLLFARLLASAQDSIEIVKATDLTIPSSPAFSLLDVNPATVTRPGFTKDLKLDMLMKDQSLISGLAIEAKPIWILLYSDVSQPEYRTKGDLERAISTLSVSVGTAEKNNQKKLAWSARMSLVRRDPLLDEGYIASVGKVLDIPQKEAGLRFAAMSKTSGMKRQIRKTEQAIQGLEKDTVSNQEKLEELRSRRDSLSSEIGLEEQQFARQVVELENSKSAALNEVVTTYLKRNWNADALDIGVGEIYDYNSSHLDSLSLTNRGFGFWLTFGTGFGSNQWLLSGLLKGINVDDKLNQEWGINVRYGEAAINFFAEFVYEKTGPEKEYTIAYGGEYRLDAKKLIEFGLRTALDKHTNLRSLTPIVKINWNLGENILRQ